ncbi:MAG: hypothetical protein IPM82_26300 [Saprospiraceae bacterium]|nr:hypothetical protein [Saprospiraceae bacterium]
MVFLGIEVQRTGKFSVRCTSTHFSTTWLQRFRRDAAAQPRCSNWQLAIGKFTGLQIQQYQ